MNAMLKLNDVQGNILRGYRSLTHARFVFLRAGSVASGRRFIEAVLPAITTAKLGSEPKTATNIAFTFAGLRALGFSTRSLASLPSAFQDGMKIRAPLLGDTEESHPKEWDPPWRLESPHFMVMVYAANRMEVEQAYHEIIGLAGEDISELQPCQEAQAIFANDVRSYRIEHFGFSDGISQPHLDVSGNAGPFRAGNYEGRAFPPSAIGEFFLGHPDEGGEVGPLPIPHAFSRNGTYLVVRKLHQHVARFREFIEQQTTHLQRIIPGAGPEYLAAKMIGRWRDGTPLAKFTASAVAGRISNNFGYADDPEGALCPLGAHIRRAHPRDSLGFEGKLAGRHRLIRRGITYGTPLPPGSPDDHLPRGLMFLAFNGDIERQFEVVQRQWMNDGDKFRQGNDRDPIVGSHDGAGRIVISGDEREGRPPFFCSGIPRFVATKGGDYFFVPSLTGLRLIASGATEAA